MRKLPLLFLLLALIPRPAQALAIDNLMDTIAMPLAVAAVSEVPGVQPDALSDLVTTLNRADVPPQQFVEVIRYVPVALVDQNGQPFVAYVQERTAQGVTGGALVEAMTDRLRTQYDLSPAMTLTEPATTFVVQDTYIPEVVATRVATLAPNSAASNPLAFIALPLAVAAVSQITGVPQDELANLVAALNQANVPPTQIVEVVRYAPVALIADDSQPFVQFVQEQTTQGVVGPALYPVIERRLQTYYPAETQITVAAPQPVARDFVGRDFNDRDFVPPVVVTRMHEVREHPHGGPPGQLKKQLGLQTGAEVVHGSEPVRQAKVRKPHRVHVDRHVDRVTPQPMISASAPAPKEHGHGAHHKQQTSVTPTFVPQAPAPAMAPAQPHGHGHGDGRGQAEGHGGGNAKGGGPPQQPHGNGGGKKHGKG